MTSFGQLLRKHRRRCWDSLRNKSLSQERLGELLGLEMGDAGYSGAAVSDWERDRSKIHEDNRRVLVALVAILHRQGGLATLEEANALLLTGNYRALDPDEVNKIFPTQQAEQVFQGKETGPPVPSDRTGTTGPQIDAIIPATRRKQLILLEKVKRFWVEGVLEKSTRDVAFIELTQEQVDAVIEHPWQKTVGPSVFDGRATIQNITTLEIFQANDHALLILGNPGAGKTITLIGLGRDLIKLAESQPIEPVPVILNLVSWAEQRPALADWVVSELSAKYLIPRQLGRRWLEDDCLHLLLDGFDEIPARYRPACIEAINSFRENHGLTGIAVCSRTEEYMAAETRLKLGGAIMIQPLTQGQIDGYLATNPRLASLRSAVQRDSALSEMARSPLLLNVMSVAYGGAGFDVASALFETADGSSSVPINRRRRLFDVYVEHMFRRRLAGSKFSPQQTLHWLAWLARKMFKNNRSPFLIEQIQPTWLPNRRWRWAYMLITGVFIALMAGLIIWLLLQQFRLTAPDLSANVASQVANVLAIPVKQAELLTIFAGNLLLGLAVTVLQIHYFEGHYLRKEEPVLKNKHYNRQIVTVGLVVASLTLITVGLFGQLALALGWAIVEAVLYLMAARYVYGRDYNNEIKTVEVLSWSWTRALQGLGAGLLLAVVFEIIGRLLFGQLAVTWTVVIPGVAGLILGGLRGRRIESTSMPNQGILLSFRNSLVAGSLSGIAIAILGGILDQPAYGLYTGLLIFFAAGSISGGSNVFKHLLVRILLWIHGDVPWRYARFLDHAADLIFLRKVGGSYIFIHPLFQQYFASLFPPPEKPLAVQAGYPLEPSHVGP